MAGRDDSSATSVLGGAKDSDAIRKRRFEDLPKQNRFFEMKHQRDALRLEYIRQGVLPDPDKAQDPSAAKSLLGTCMEMCPDFEREEREFQNEGDSLEMFSGTSRIDPALAVKIYRRPAAGRELPLPEDVRPPSVLRKTLDYLFHQLLPSDPSSMQFTAVQPFMWNRTRAIRQDFIVQGLRGALEIECHERIARYHILCLHWKGGTGAEGWSEQQELEQLRKTIRSLTEFYEDLRRSTGASSPNEAEFRAYNLLLHMQDPETLREVESLPSEVFDAASIQAALRLRGYAQRSNNVVKRGRPLNTEATMNLWTRFFGEIRRNKDVSYLLACLAENAFSQVRAGAIKAMGKTYLAQHAPLPLEYLQRSLGMDDGEEARLFGVALNCEEVRTGDPSSPPNAMRLGKANEEKPLPSAPFSRTIVEVKRASQSSQAIVDGLLSGAASLLPIEGGPIVAPAQAARLPGLMEASKVSLPASVSPSTSSRPAPSPSSASLPPPMITSSSAASSYQVRQSSTAAFDSSLSASALVFTPASMQQTTPKTLPTPPSMPSKPTSFPPFSTKPQPPPQEPFTFKASSKPHSDVNGVPAPAPATTRESSSRIAFKEGDEPAQLTVISTKKEEEPAIPFLSAERSEPAEAPPILARPAKAEQVRPAEGKPRRTVASVTSYLFDTLLASFIDGKIRDVGEQACLRELRIRRKDARGQLVDGTSQQLMERLEGEAVDDVVASVASEAIATAFRARSLERLALRGRKRAAMRAMERKGQAERLLAVRMKLERRGLLLSGKNSRQGAGRSLHQSRDESAGVVEDHTLNTLLVRARAERHTLWKSDTFLRSIVQKVQDVAPADFGLWTVALSVYKDTSSTSAWLRLKLGLEQGAAVKEKLREEEEVRVIDVGTTLPAKSKKERDVGLVIFELDPSTTDNLSDASEGWAAQRHRLELLSQQSMVMDSRFSPKLLLISWTGSETAHEDEWRRKKVLKQLHLGATDAERFAWGEVAICSFGRQAKSLQAKFQDSLDRVMGSVDWNPRRQRLDFETLSALCKASWKRLLDNVDVIFSRLGDSEGVRDGKQVAMQTFIAIAFLAHQSLGDLLAVSDTLLEAQSNGVVFPVPRLTAEEKEAMVRESGDASGLLLDMALTQLNECQQEKGSDSLLLIQTWLLQQYEGQAATFPWTAYFERLYQWHLVQIEEVWLECRMRTRREMEPHLAATTDLCQAAWSEIEWKLKQARPVSLSPRKRRGSDNVTLFTASESNSNMTNKNSSTSTNTNKLRRVDSRKPAGTAQYAAPQTSTSSTVVALRALMASASHLLEDDTHR